MVKSMLNAEHYSWGNHCDGWHLLQTDSLSVIQEQMPPGASEHLHLHHQSQQVFYILSGTAAFGIDDIEVLVQAGESLHIPAGTRHFIANRTEAPLVFLVISEPEAHGDRQNL